LLGRALVAPSEVSSALKSWLVKNLVSITALGNVGIWLLADIKPDEAVSARCEIMGCSWALGWLPAMSGGRIAAAEAWNKGKLIGQKAPLKAKDIWAIRIRLQLGHKVRDLALFNLAIDSKLRARALVKLRVSDVSDGFASHGDAAEDRSPCPIRDHPIDSRGRAGLDHPRRVQGLRLPGHQPSVGPASPIDEALRSDLPLLGRRSWPRVGLLRHTNDAPDKSFFDLPTYTEAPGRAVACWSHEAGKHCGLSRNRGR